MSRSQYSSPPSSSRDRRRSYTPKHKYKSYDSRSDDLYPKMSSSKYPPSDSYSRKPVKSSGVSRVSKYDKIEKYTSYPKDDRYDKYDRYDKFASKYDKSDKPSKYDKLYDLYDRKDKYEKVPSYNGSDKYRTSGSYRSPQKSPVSYGRHPESKARYESSRYSSKDPLPPLSYSKRNKSPYEELPYKSTKNYLPSYGSPKSRHSTKIPTKARPSSSKEFYGSSYSGSSKRPRDPYDKMGPPRKPLLDTDYDRYPKEPYLAGSKYEAVNNNSYERYVIGNSVVYGSPGHDPEALYSPSKSRTHRRKARAYSPYPSLSQDLHASDRRADRVSGSTYPPDRKMRPRRGRMRSRSPVPRKPSYVTNKDPKGKASSRLTRLPRRSPGRRPLVSDRRRSSNLPRPTSPPKPLLSINLSASSIGLSKHRVKQTLTIDEDEPQRRKAPFRIRRDVLHPKRRPDDLRLWIESRKSSHAKKRPTQESRTSRSARLSAAVQKVRLLESKRRLAAKSKGPLASRLTRGRLSRPVTRRDTKPNKESTNESPQRNERQSPMKSPSQDSPLKSPQIKQEKLEEPLEDGDDVSMPSEEL